MNKEQKLGTNLRPMVLALLAVVWSGASIAADQVGTSPAAPAVSGQATEGATIYVTARRQNERLIDVPASVTVVTGDTLEKTGTDRVSGIIQLTPGVTVVTGSAEAGDTQINIRGINGARDAESSVALVVDGILKTNTAQLNQNQGILQQVEVLKGPQGAIYGRNAAAGAVVMTTMKPSAKLMGGITGSYANEKTMKSAAYLSGPLSDTAGFVLSGSSASTDGYYQNTFLKQKAVDDQKDNGIDGRLFAKLSPNTSVDVKTHYQKLSGASINFNATFHLPYFAAFNKAFYEDVNKHEYKYYGNIRPTNNQETFDTSAKIEHDFGATKLTAWTLFSDIKQSLTAEGTSADFGRYISPALGAPANATNTAVMNKCFATTAALTGFPVNAPGFIGATPVPFLFAPTTGSTFGPYSPSTCDGTQFQSRNQKDISGEVRLASNTDGPLKWQVGAYYLKIDRDTAVSLGADTGQGVLQSSYNGPASVNPTSQLYADKFKTDVYAAFGSADYDLADNLKIGGALRYDIEKRNVSSRVPNVSDPITGAKINPGLPSTGAIPDQSATFKQLQPKVTMSYQPNRATNLYANWGIGFKPGGFNNQGSAAVVNANFNDGKTPGTINANVLIKDLFSKEKSSAFEAGVKGSLGGVNYDLAAYYTQITDMQFFEFFVGGFGLLRVVSNIDKVDVKGVELNLNTRLTKGWTMFGGVNVTDSEIKKNTSRTYTIGNKSPYTASYTGNIGTQIERALNENMDIFMRMDYRITGETWFHTVQNQERPTVFTGLIPISALSSLPAATGTARYDLAKRYAFGVLNLRVGLQGEKWHASIFANNALDKKYANDVIPAIEFGGSFISPGQRRYIGVEGGYKF
jgi:iron complex outermembrane receptor protein